MKATKLVLCVAAFTLSACQANATEVDPGVAVVVGAASMRVPTDWASSLNDPSGNRQAWSPSANDGKESITLRVTQRPMDVVADDLLDQALDAQGILQKGRLLRQERITTPGKLPGLWMEVSFRPPSVDTTYFRTQVTVVGAQHIFHILYTARTPDGAQRAIHMAVDSINEEG